MGGPIRGLLLSQGVKYCRKPIPDRAAAVMTGAVVWTTSGTVHTKVHGPWGHFATVLTGLKLTTDPPFDLTGGSWRRCLTAYPSKAGFSVRIVDGSRCLVHILSSPGSFFPEHRTAVGDQVNSCDLCLGLSPSLSSDEGGGPSPTSWACGPSNRTPSTF